MTALAPNLAIRGSRRSDTELELAVEEVGAPQLIDDDDIIVEVLAAPINPTDIVTLFGAADPDTAERLVSDGAARTVLRLTAAAGGRLSTSEKPKPPGSEGAGRVVAAGPGANAQGLLGRTVAILGDGTFARYVKAAASNAIVLDDDVSPALGASALINPLTALGMVETMRNEGFSALVHTAAASNLGQMLVRLCGEERIGLVNIVRTPEQVRLLRTLGAEHVVDMSQDDFTDDLVTALRATGATLAFDAIGGGTVAARILAAMDQALILAGARFPHGPQYGTVVPKKVLIYGGLDTSPTQVGRTFGTAWSVAGWLLFPFLASIGPERADELKARVAQEITTTFASTYTRSISLAEALHPEVIQEYTRRATGAKYLVEPWK